MPSTGTRLFKIATQINVGKETIIEFLQAKGFKVENKATATLTEEMVDLVMGNFQKEYSAASKQRAKVVTPTPKEEAHAETTHDHHHDHIVHETFNASLVESHIQEQHEIHAPSAHAGSREEVEVKAEAARSETPVELPHSVQVSPTKTDGIAVGTVIQLDSGSSRRSTRGKKEPEPEVLTKTTPTKPASTPKADESISQTSTSQAPASQAPASQISVAPQPIVAEAISATTPVVAESAIVESGVVAPDSVIAAAEVSVAHNDTAHDADSHDGLDAFGKKKRRKKMMGEIEYQAGDFTSAAAASMMPKLTILGKIDLGQKPRVGDPKRKTVEVVKRPEVKAKPAPAKDWVAGDDAKKGIGVNKKKRKKGKREQVNALDVDRAIRRTLSGQDDSAVGNRSKLRQRRRAERAEEQDRQAELRELESSILRVTEFITVAELANLMSVPTNEIIVKCMSLGLMVSINQRLEKDTISLIADDYGFTVEFEDEFMPDVFDDEDDEDEELKPRAPIVTVMGHVDHGKTSLLDYIRKASVVTGESGGITQHIGAYSVKMTDGKFITFLDTPGHQAFTAMRARGAQVTDLVVLIVAADDNVMPQTIEAISHARAANVPMIVAMNKIDKADANTERVRQQLADQNVLVEEWGGKFQSVEISAKKGTNVDQLLEKILLEAELLHLQANPDRSARGTVIEAKIDKGKGPVATVIVQKGTLRIGDPFICGVYAGRVRAMLDENGDRVEVAIPATPVQLLGLDGVPQAGDVFAVMESESEAKELANQRQQIKREQDFKQVRHVTLDDIGVRIKSGGTQELKIILKGDTDGSVEALADSLQKLATPEVSVTIIYRAVGPISESDVMLAAASDAVIIGFHVRPPAQIAKLAETESVDIRLYRIIYDCINEVKLALEGMLQPEIKEEIAGVAEIREVFRISKLGNIAGCYMLEGKINRNDIVRVIRDGFEVFTGKLSSLKRIKEDVREVDAGFECGIAVDNFNDIKVGDLIEAVRKTEVKRKL